MSTINAVFFSLLSFSLLPCHFSPRMGYRRVPKICIGFKVTKRRFGVKQKHLGFFRGFFQKKKRKVLRSTWNGEKIDWLYHPPPPFYAYVMNFTLNVHLHCCMLTRALLHQLFWFPPPNKIKKLRGQHFWGSKKWGESTILEGQQFWRVNNFSGVNNFQGSNLKEKRNNYSG